jgi:hypothetical protein
VHSGRPAGRHAPSPSAGRFVFHYPILRQRRKQRDEIHDEIPPHDEIPVAGPLDAHVLSLDEVKAIHATARPPDAAVAGTSEVAVRLASGEVKR